jgi:hypothetical protein
MIDLAPRLITLLDAAAAGRWPQAHAQLEALSDDLPGDALYGLEDLLRQRRACHALGNGLFVLAASADDPLCAAALVAHGYVAAATGHAPLALVEMLPAAAPTHVRVSGAGLAFIALGGATTDAPAALVHEFAHCVAISGLGFLDEGFATLLERRFQSIESPGQWWERPSLGALLEMDWSHDPHFTALDAPDPDAPYLLAAWFVGQLIDLGGMGAVVTLLHRLRRRHAETRLAPLFRAGCGADVDALDAELRPAPTGAAIDAVRLLADGDRAGAVAALPQLRAAAVHGVAGGGAALARAAITIGIQDFDATGLLARAEAHWAIKAMDDAGVHPVLTAYRAILQSFDAPGPIEKRTAGVRAVDQFAALVRSGGADGETLIAAAKAQTYAPEAFLQVPDWRQRLAALGDDQRLGRIAARLLHHPRFQEERIAC